MAQTRSSRSNRKVFYILGLFNILMLLQNANCYDFKVGGSGDWSVPMDANANNYNQWANMSRFQIGDTLCKFIFISMFPFNCHSQISSNNFSKNKLR